MPNTKSASKALRKSERRKKQNLVKKRAFKDAVKVYKKLVVGGKTDEARARLPKVYKALDKAAKKNIIKPNKASRTKSRLSRLLKAEG